MSRYIFIIVLLCTALWSNPYKSLDVQTQIQVMVNHFFNEQIKQTFPEKPTKEQYVEEEVDLNPTNYELYYNYIQRLKAIEQSAKEQKSKIEENFRGKAAYYNGKLDAIKRDFQLQENRTPLIQKAINNGFKVVYGKPYVSDFRNKQNSVEATLSVRNIYDLQNSLELRVVFNKKIKNMHEYKRYPAIVKFHYDGNYLQIESINITIDSNEYKGQLKNPQNGKIKLNVKINDDIFQKIQLEDN